MLAKIILYITSIRY